MQFIRVSDGAGAPSRKISVVTDSRGNNKVSLETIRQYYPNADGLEYRAGREYFGLRYERGYIYLCPDQEPYEVCYPVSKNLPLTGNKLRTHRRIMATINGDDESSSDNASDDNIVVGMPKKMKMKSKGGTRLMNIGWKHRTSETEEYKQVTAPLGGVKQVALNLNQRYDHEDILDICVANMRNQQNQIGLDSSTKVSGNSRNQVIQPFTDSSGKECDSWEYVRCKVERGSRLRVYILSTDLPTISEVAENAGKNEGAVSANRHDATSIGNSRGTNEFSLEPATRSSTTSKMHKSVSSRKPTESHPSTVKYRVPAQVQLQTILQKQADIYSGRKCDSRQMAHDIRKVSSSVYPTKSHESSNGKIFDESQEFRRYDDTSENVETGTSMAYLRRNSSNNDLSPECKSPAISSGFLGNSGLHQSMCRNRIEAVRNHEKSQTQIDILQSYRTPQSSSKKFYGGTTPQLYQLHKCIYSQTHDSVQTSKASTIADQDGNANYDESQKSETNA
ncbi:hypothetical protein QAD02_012418 [Eretmocerus hayati]|uniref:Uncharacterized protein n=1 Tax=Eretmocerus hayati TaxID=131215 RepID=A0ACC2P1C2_9HYME|nr:hypothetical protein QAD02_012418 [Eretmocerus hayati]